MKGLFYAGLALALLALGVYVGRTSAPQPAAQPQLRPYWGDYTPIRTCPPGYTDDGKGGCTVAPGYQVDPAFVAAQQAANAQRDADSARSRAEFNANEDALREQQALEQVAHSVDRLRDP